MKRGREPYVDVGYLRHAASDVAPEELRNGLCSQPGLSAFEDASCDVLIDRRTGMAFTLTSVAKPLLPGFAATLDQYRRGEL